MTTPHPQDRDFESMQIQEFWRTGRKDVDTNTVLLTATLGWQRLSINVPPKWDTDYVVFSFNPENPVDTACMYSVKKSKLHANVLCEPYRYGESHLCQKYGIRTVIANSNSARNLLIELAIAAGPAVGYAAATAAATDAATDAASDAASDAATDAASDAASVAASVAATDAATGAASAAATDAASIAATDAVIYCKPTKNVRANETAAKLCVVASTDPAASAAATAAATAAASNAAIYSKPTKNVRANETAEKSCVGTSTDSWPTPANNLRSMNRHAAFQWAKTHMDTEDAAVLFLQKVTGRTLVYATKQDWREMGLRDGAIVDLMHAVCTSTKT